ncbi:MAG: hypothetical protein QOE27_65 [Solirubrobacteraceae bacterium]|jgi:hypothetical protein|nr:hypothetical protein [Solirubrobacteraceae bacterium]MEA2302329.1 hypothetical protein [Solirubrobacteraceae bacterium]MEA2355737.1 hypothetical protein [Solirubrobacteraceae bacterium]
MPVGDSHLAFAEAAGRDGIELDTRADFDWLTELGHLTLEDFAAEPTATADPEALHTAAEALGEMYGVLGGDPSVLESCRANLFIPVDLVHQPTGTIIEIDEAHHFTSFRLKTLDRYPASAEVGFDLEAYRELCREKASEYDKFARGQAAKGFGFGGVQRERAYRDALRDLGAPAMGLPPVVRFVALDGDGAAAYARHRESLVELLGVTR